MSKPLPSQEALRGLFFHNPETGAFVWKESRGRVKAGQVAGSCRKRDGRREIRINGQIYLASRLIWMYHYGIDPGENVIDHINRNPTDDRIANLRMVSQEGNMQNIERGRGWSKIGNRYYARVYKSNKQICLGGFATPEQAHQAYLEALL